LSNHWGENLDTLFAALYKPAQLLPCVKPGYARGCRALQSTHTLPMFY
jgi:hypothetical protein